jgi:small GTP-binding protein
MVLLGDPAVGKTSLVRKFVFDMFGDKYLSTLGAKPTKKVIQLGEHNITLIIWDIAGQSYSLHPTYYSGAKGALLVCDLTRRRTAESLLSWHTSLKAKVGRIPVRVLANKDDLPNQEYDDNIIRQIGFEPLRTSAKTGANVDRAFQELTELMINE